MAMKVYKLVSGEYIISAITEETRDSVILDSPAAIMMQSAGDGKVGAALAPFAPFSKNSKVTLSRTAIMAELEADLRLENEYNRIFGSGIVIASSPIASM